MTAIASLLSTTAVTLPGAPAPTGVTTLAPFPDLALAQAQAEAGSGATLAPASGRQAAADDGKALPLAQSDTDALAWLDPALADAGGATDPIARAGAPAPVADVETVATARPISGRRAVTPAGTVAGERMLSATDTSATDAPAEAADDGAVSEAQQVTAGGADFAPPAIMSPIIPAPFLQGSEGSIEQSDVSVSQQPARLASRTDEAPSVALSPATQLASAAVPHAVSPLAASAASTPSTGSQRAGAVFANAATPIPDHALAQPASRVGAPIRAARASVPSDMADITLAPLSNEARGSAPAIDAAVPIADRAASASQVPAGALRPIRDVAVPVRADAAKSVVTENLRGMIDAPTSGAATSNSVADASGLSGLGDVHEPSHLRGSRPPAPRGTSGSARAQTLVAGADARVPLIGGTPLPIATPAATIDPGAQPSGLSPALSRFALSNTATDAARGVAMPTVIARDATTRLASAAGLTVAAVPGFVTEAIAPAVSIAAPSNGAAVSFAPPVHAAAGTSQPVAITTPLAPLAPGTATAEQSILHPDAAVREATPTATAPAPRVVADLPAPVLRPTSAPAAQVFAAAIHRALGEQDARQPDDLAPPLAPLAPAIPGVALAGAVPQGALDMRHEHWPAAMIDRIVTLRDMAAENDTRLRLSPDMLGMIDVSLKRDGDQVQVQITAEQAQTRQLLADAQPRLAELADARGVKLQLTGGHAGGGAGQQPGSGGDAPRQQTPGTSLPTRPRSAERSATDDTDQRIA